MKCYIYHSGGTPYVLDLIDELKKYVDICTFPSECDMIISIQMGGYNELLQLHRAYPHIPFITYVWDCYEWIWEYDRNYDWRAYGEIVKISKQIWVPSSGQQLRVNQHWGVDLSKTRVIKAYARLFDFNNTIDNGYVCNPLREIPDRHLGWIEKACDQLSIPYIHGGRKRGSIGKSWDEYKEFIAQSSFIVCPWYEASTGGMSLIEGYNLGKEILICNSPYMGAKDYFGDRANYFDPTYESLVESIKKMWDNRYKKSKYSLSDKKIFCKENHSIEIMAYNLYKAMIDVCN